MSEIRVKENESLENALKRFKRSVQKAGIQQEVRKREHYVSPSLKRKQKSEQREYDSFHDRFSFLLRDSGSDGF